MVAGCDSEDADAAVALERGRHGTQLKNHPPIVSREQWDAAHARMHHKEKAHSRARDALAAERRRMPWMAVEKDYAFIGPEGEVSLLSLFGGHRQLIVYRAFMDPGVSHWPERGCIGCSMVADQVAHPAHLNARDTGLAFVSRGSQADIARLKARMGWEHIPWYTLTDDFGFRCGPMARHQRLHSRRRTHVSHLFVSGRGDEQMGNTWNYLDITALGRQGEWEDSPEGYPQTPPYQWWVWHDDGAMDPDRDA